MKNNNILSPLQRTRDNQVEPRRERTTQYEHSRQAAWDLESVLLSRRLGRTQADVLPNDHSNSSESSMSSTHGNDMFQRVHEGPIMRSDNGSPTSGERRNNSISLIDLIDEALAILDDVSDDNNDGLGSPFRKQ